MKKNKTPPRIWPSIKRDHINPSDYLKYDFPRACDDCSHFTHESESCSLGYNADLHRRQEQDRTYLLSGNMALCRFHEID